MSFPMDCPQRSERLGWAGDANEAGGPLGWAPLHYVCHSCFETVELARDLLDRGADPNAYFANACHSHS